MACSQLIWPPMPACANCLGTSFEAVASKGEGTLWTYTIAHRTLPAHQDDAPFAVGIVALDDEPDRIRVLGRIVDCPLDTLRIGMRLRVELPTSSEDPIEFHSV